MTQEKWDAGFLFVAVGIGALILGFAFGLKVGAHDDGRANAALRAWQEEAVERGHMEVWNRGSLRNAHYWWKEE